MVSLISTTKPTRRHLHVVNKMLGTICIFSIKMCPYQRSMFTNNVFDFVDIVLFCKDIITHSIKKIKLLTCQIIKDPSTNVFIFIYR